MKKKIYKKVVDSDQIIISGLNDYVGDLEVKINKLTNRVIQQKKLIDEQKELIDELLKNKSISDSKQKLIECLTSSLFEELNKSKLLSRKSNLQLIVKGKVLSGDEAKAYMDY